MTTKTNTSSSYHYGYNLTTAILILPPLFLMYDQSAEWAQAVFLTVLLLLYAVDLCGLDPSSECRSIVFIFFDAGHIIVTLSLWIDRLISMGSKGDGVRIGMLDLVMETLLVFNLAYWGQLQIKWLAHAEDLLDTKSLEHFLHVSLPLVSTSVLLRKLVTYFDGGITTGSGDSMALACPHLFTVWYAFALLNTGNAFSSFPPSGTSASGNGNNGERTIAATDGCTLTHVLLFLPTLMHLAIFHRRIFVRYGDMNGSDVADLVLVPSVSFGLHYAMMYMGKVWWWEDLHPFLRLCEISEPSPAKSPDSPRTSESLVVDSDAEKPVEEERAHKSVLTDKAGYFKSLFRNDLQRLMFVAAVYGMALLSFQYRYLIPSIVSHQYHHTENDPVFVQRWWAIVIYSTAGLVLSTLSRPIAAKICNSWSFGGGMTDSNFTAACVMAALCISVGVPLLFMGVYLKWMGISSFWAIVTCYAVALLLLRHFSWPIIMEICKKRFFKNRKEELKEERCFSSRFFSSSETDSKEEDVSHLTAVCGMAALGVSLGMPQVSIGVYLVWVGVTSLFVSSRVLKYISSFFLLEIINSVTLLSHKQNFLQKTIWIIPGTIFTTVQKFSFHLLRFGATCLILSYFLFSYRSKKGNGGVIAAKGFQEASMIKRRYAQKSLGILFIFCVGSLTVLEGALVYGSPMDNVKGSWEELYPLQYAVGTGVVLSVLSIWMFCRRKEDDILFGVLYPLHHLVSLALCTAKIIGFLVVGSDRDDGESRFLQMRGEGDWDGGRMHEDFLRTAFIASSSIVMIGLPYVLYDVTDKLSDKEPGLWIIFALSMVILPWSVPTVWIPAMEWVLASHGGGRGLGYYEEEYSPMEVVGYSASLWGFTVLSVFSQLFTSQETGGWKDLFIFFIPRKAGVAEGSCYWWKASWLSFWLGLLLLLTKPGTPFWFGGDETVDVTTASLIKAISSRSMDRTDGGGGGWASVMVVLALFLSAVGFQWLDMNSKRFSLDLSVIGVLFGAGTSWCLTRMILIAGGYTTALDTDLETTMGTARLWIPALLILCPGAMVSALAYHVVDRDLTTKVVQRLCFLLLLLTFLIFILATGLPSSETSSTIPYNNINNDTGWQYAVLAGTSLSALLLAVALRLRSNERKTEATIGLGNGCCLVSWLVALVMIYRRYGVASIGIVDGWQVWGVKRDRPASVMLTILVSSILLLLEGEPSNLTASNKTNTNTDRLPFFCKPLPINLRLRRLFLLALSLAGTVLIIVSLYAIFIRGIARQRFGTLVTHEDVFHHFYGIDATSTTSYYDYAGGNGDDDWVGLGLEDEDINGMMDRSTAHILAVQDTGKLAACSFWTTRHQYWNGPLVHLLGVLAVLPTFWVIISSLWGGRTDSFWMPWPLLSTGAEAEAEAEAEADMVWSAIVRYLPWIFFTFLFCSGIPSLSAAWKIASLVGVLYALDVSNCLELD